MYDPQVSQWACNYLANHGVNPYRVEMDSWTKDGFYDVKNLDVDGDPTLTPWPESFDWHAFETILSWEES